jgi:hypothetical protein
MNIVNLPIIDSTSEEEFRKIYEDTYISKETYFEGVLVKFYPEDFEHICYEYGENAQYKAKFGIRRSKKLLAIKEICEGRIPYILIYEKDREKKSVCVLAESIEFSLFLTPLKTEKGYYLRIGTIIAYGKEIERRMEKQKTNGEIIKKITDAFTG